MATTTNIGSMFVELGLDDSDFRGGMKAAVGAIRFFQTAAGKLKSTLDTAVIAGFTAAAASAAAFGAATTMAGAEFEHAINTVGSIAQATPQHMKALEEQARQLGSTTQFTATEAAVAMQDFARAGLQANQIIGASGPAMLLAGATGSEMAQATNLLASSMAQFGMDAGQSTRITDVFSQALTNSLFDMSSLTEAMKYGGTVGASFGMSIEETTAAIAQFRNLGLEGSMAGTNFRMAMAAASRPSKRAAEVLKAYNIELKDINPELVGFADILRTIGEAGMSTTDALDVFGIRSGANMATISRGYVQAIEGASDYEVLLNKLNDSVGSTEALYERMGQTVLFQSKVSISALQEVMLSVFDTFKGPLQALLRETAATLQHIGAAFGRHSGVVSARFSRTFGSLVSFLRENRAELSIGFIQLISSVIEATQAMVEWMPIILDVAKMLALVWATANIAAFASMVARAAANVKIFATTVRTAYFAIVAMSGGTLALFAAITSAVAIMAKFASGSYEAARATERLVDAEKMLMEATDQANRRREEYANSIFAYGEGLEVNIVKISNLLSSESQLGDRLEANISSLAGLTSAQIQAGIASGELFKATLNGTDVVLDHMTALRMQWDETLLAEDASTGYAKALASVDERMGWLKSRYASVSTALSEYQKQVARGTRKHTAFTGVLRRYGSTIEDVESKQTHLSEEISKLQAVQDGLIANRTLAMEKLRAEEVKLATAVGLTREAHEASSDAADRRKQALEDLFNAMKRRLALVEAIDEQIRVTDVSADERSRVLRERRMREINEAFDEELRLRVELGKDTEQLEKDRQAALYSLNVLWSLKLNEERKKRAADIERSVTEFLESEVSRRAGRIYSIELEWLKKAEEFKDASMERRAEIDQVYQRRILDARAEITEAVIQLTREESAEVLSLQDKTDRARFNGAKRYLSGVLKRARQRAAIEEELAKKLVELSDATSEEKFAIEAHYMKKIAKLDEDDAKARKDRAKQIVSSVGKAAVAGVKFVAKSINGIISAVGSALQSITGFNLDLFGAIDGIADEMSKLSKLKSDLEKGEISREQYNEGIQGLPGSTEQAAAEFVQELVDGVIFASGIFVDAMPEIVARLAEAIPLLVSELALTVTGVVKGIIQALPQIIDALTGAFASVVEVIAHQLPYLIQVVVDQIPTIIQALGEVIPMLLEAVAAGIAQVMEAIPAILTEILNQLPAIITALLEAVATIFSAVVDALPEIVARLIGALPQVVEALVVGLLSMVDVLITEVYGKLVPAIVSMIPEIIERLLQAVVLLIQAVVEALPTLIAALVSAVAEAMVAATQMIPKLLQVLIVMLPQLITAVIQLIPAIIIALVEALPVIFAAIVENLPAIVKALFKLIFVQIPVLAWEMVKALVLALWDALKEIGKFFIEIFKAAFEQIKEWFSNLFSKKDKKDKGKSSKKSNEFGDTPGVMRMRQGGEVRLAAGDFFAAAQRPGDLMAQALQVPRPKSRGLNVGSIGGLAPALMELSQNIERMNRPTGAGELRVVVEADGQVLDEVLYRAGKRGRTPRLNSKMRKATVMAGVSPGFNRGKYTG